VAVDAGYSRSYLHHLVNLARRWGHRLSESTSPITRRLMAYQGRDFQGTFAGIFREPTRAAGEGRHAAALSGVVIATPSG